MLWDKLEQVRSTTGGLFCFAHGSWIRHPFPSQLESLSSLKAGVFDCFLPLAPVTYQLCGSSWRKQNSNRLKQINYDDVTAAMCGHEDNHKEASHKNGIVYNWTDASLGISTLKILYCVIVVLEAMENVYIYRLIVNN